jgi:hypothetical protein
MGEVRADPKGRRRVPSLAIDSEAHVEKKGFSRKTVGRR